MNSTLQRRNTTSVHKKEKTIKFKLENSEKEYQIVLNNQEQLYIQEEEFLNQKKDILGIKNIENYCLYEKTSQYIIYEFELFGTKFSDNTIFIFIDCQPLVTDMIKKLQDVIDKPETQNKCLLTCKLLGIYVKAPQFTNLFIVEKGIDKIVTLIKILKTNAQAYAAEAISGLMEYQNACQYVNENQHIFDTFYTILIKNLQRVNTTKYMLKIFITLQAYLEEKFSPLFLKAAENYAKESNTRILEGYCNLFKDNYYDNKEIALAIIISMLTYTEEKCSRIELSQLILKLKEAPITDALEIKNSSPEEQNEMRELFNNHPQYKEFLDTYQRITNEVIEGSTYQVEELNKKIQTYEESMTSLEKRTEYVFQTQKFYDEIVADFIQFKKLSEVCTDQAGYYDPYCPTERYNLKLGKKINVDNNGRVEIKQLSNNEVKDEVSILQKYIATLKDNKQKLEKEKEELQLKISEYIKNEKLRGDVENFEVVELQNLSVELRKNIDILNKNLEIKEMENKNLINDNEQKEKEKNKFKQEIENIQKRFYNFGIENENFKISGTEKKIKNINNKNKNFIISKETQIKILSIIKENSNNLHSNKKNTITPVKENVIKQVSNNTIPPVKENKIKQVSNFTILPVKENRIKQVSNNNIPPVKESTIPPVPGSTIKVVSSSTIPPVPGSTIPPVPGSTIPPVPGSTIPPVPGSTIPPVPGSTIPPVPGSTIPPVPGSTIPPVPGSTIPPVPGSTIPPVPGSTIPPVPGSTIPPVPGSTIPPVPGSKIPPVPGSTIPPIPGNTIPPVPGSTIPSVPGVPKVPGIPSIPGVPPISGIPSVPLFNSVKMPSGVGIPGLFSMPKRVLPTKPKLKLPQRCKAFPWVRIIMDPNKEEMNNSLWKEMKEQDIKIEDVCDVFSIKKVVPKNLSKSTLPLSIIQNEKIKFLNPKRAQSVGITIAKLPAIASVSIALDTMNTILLSESNIEQLNREYIKDDEIEEYKQHISNNENAIFEKGEEYLISLYKIPDSKIKLEIWEFINEYNMQVPIMEKMIIVINKAIDTLKKSEIIPLLFSYILTVGNILNCGNDKGQADGFDLKVLSKISDTKGKNGQTLIQFICNLIVQTHPDFHNISEKFEDVKNALDYSYIEVPKNSKRVIGSSRELERNIESLKVNDEFKEKSEEFLKKYKTEKIKIKSDLSDIDNKYSDLMIYFCVDPKESYYKNPDELFKLFNNFFKEVDSAIPKNVEKKVFVPKHKIGDKVGNQRELLSNMMKLNALKRK